MNQQQSRRVPQRRPIRPAPRPTAPQQETALVIDEETARVIRETEGRPMQAITGYDPVSLSMTAASQGTVVTPSGQRSGRVVSRPMPTPPAPVDEEEDVYDSDDDDEYEDDEDFSDAVDDVMEYEDEEPQDAESFYASEDDEASAVEQSLYGDIPAPPPTAMPVQLSGWLDLGQQDDQRFAQMFRGWKIKMRLDASFGMLSAVEYLQEARDKAIEHERRTGKKINTVKVAHLRTILEDLVVAWNFVDEFHHPLPQPPVGLRFLRPDLLAATLNRAMMELTPSKKRKKRSTRR